MTAPAFKSPADNTRTIALLAGITSSTPTRYRLVKDESNEPIYVYCALDALEYAWITGGSYRIVAESPVDVPIEFMLTPTGPEPATAWMSTVIRGRLAQLPIVEGIPSRCCPYTHFFVSKDAYETWSAALPDEVGSHIECLPLYEAWQNARCVLNACKVLSTDEC